MNEQAQLDLQHKPHYNGPDYDPRFDQARLSGQTLRVFDLMKDGIYRTLDEIALAISDPAASISAQLRHLRKPRFGKHTVLKRRRGEPSNGLFEYSLVVNRE